ncbi:hypothetical protein P4U43_15015 [Arthrobacter sp. EH-1B-1]|uniref:Uncharacterized protein n=1 Tax=Arthrobacter vasquezii TaxID=2977629 RepID=A0ABT6CYH5_9MICC|nr:hypothetical protein [Arthrobacter vasquezii]MDF9279098.1 hypothetical protein [Arthrobacter vasquezii]
MTITRMLTRTVTADTTETITAPALPADDRTGDGYDWMNTLNGSGWVPLPGWGSEGWDAGAWPYIIFTVARHRDEVGELFGYGTYVEGDTRAHWYRSQEACFEALTEDVFFHWKSGQSHGPQNLPPTAAGLAARDRQPYDPAF